jgi:hypothetical protein
MKEVEQLTQEKKTVLSAKNDICFSIKKAEGEISELNRKLKRTVSAHQQELTAAK